MRKLICAAFAATFALSGAAFAQSSDPSPGQIGLVMAKDGILVPLTTDAGIPVINAKKGGTACKLHEGDTFKVVAILDDGSVLVKRKLHIRFAVPSKDTCPAGALVKLGKPEAAAAVMAHAAAKAEKAAKTK